MGLHTVVDIVMALAKLGVCWKIRHYAKSGKNNCDNYSKQLHVTHLENEDILACSRGQSRLLAQSHAVCLLMEDHILEPFALNTCHDRCYMDSQIRQPEHQSLC